MIIQTFNKRLFRSDNDHFNIFFNAEIPDSFKIVQVKGHINAALCRTRVTGSDIEGIGPDTLIEFPGEGMFSTPGA